ncbi:MAG: NDP-sugar synthase [Promethearchaeati archaeon SRVP18_Atabeyarchaeia-1]
MVLAGGYGTRLRPLTYSRPKPMLPIGPKPVLQYLIEMLSKQGFREIIVTANYLEEQIKSYFGDGSRFGVTMRYPREDTPLGTAGSVKNADQFLDETFAVIQGDNITDIDLARQLEYHKKRKAFATLSVIQVKQPWKYGVVKLGRSDRITGFQEKPPPQKTQSDLISTGLYVLEPEALDLIPRNRQCDFAGEVFPAILEKGNPLYGYRAKGFWTDIGSVEGFLEASAWILSKLSTSISATADIAKATIKGRVWIGDGSSLEKGVTIQGPAYIEDSCTIRKGASVRPGTVLKRGVSVGESSNLNGASVLGSAEIHSRVTLDKCILDEKCEIGSNTRIERYAVLGAGCKIGEDTLICSEVRLEPHSTVGREKVIRTQGNAISHQRER